MSTPISMSLLLEQAEAIVSQTHQKGGLNLSSFKRNAKHWFPSLHFPATDTYQIAAKKVLDINSHIQLSPPPSLPEVHPSTPKARLAIHLRLNDGDPTYPVAIIEGAEVDVDDGKTTLGVVLAMILPFLNCSPQLACHNHDIMIEMSHMNILLTRKPTEQSADTTEFKLYEELEDCTLLLCPITTLVVRSLFKQADDGPCSTTWVGTDHCTQRKPQATLEIQSSTSSTTNSSTANSTSTPLTNPSTTHSTEADSNNLHHMEIAVNAWLSEHPDTTSRWKMFSSVSHGSVPVWTVFLIVKETLALLVSEVARFQKKHLRQVMKQYNIGIPHLNAADHVAYATDLIDNSDLELIKRKLKGVQKRGVAQCVGEVLDCMKAQSYPLS
ncbi:uncharacterized protein F5147DRAFT_777901 [Suillus discolor]|uniref:Uncharacterized protein n=1 Tax=Suillus discolor TaxID=1912936 RepID=A0A9P7JPQ7_9AGAM|nr:uncharacterized protein F5147DRAFT_777901 [Suillus discolor]KAG2097739.1 hypothetical protein F5147DRAFT_777901 [Suillus discolor]